MSGYVRAASFLIRFVLYSFIVDSMSSIFVNGLEIPGTAPKILRVSSKIHPCIILYQLTDPSLGSRFRRGVTKILWDNSDSVIFKFNLSSKTFGWIFSWALHTLQLFRATPPATSSHTTDTSPRGVLGVVYMTPAFLWYVLFFVGFLSQAIP